MNGTEKTPTELTEAPRTVVILGVPLALGCGIAGVELGPAAMRAAGLKKGLRALGYEVQDLGDLPLPNSDEDNDNESGDYANQYADREFNEGREEKSPGQTPQHSRLKYLAPIRETCTQVSAKVADILAAGKLPLVLGGDHALAIGSLAGLATHFRQVNKPWGLLWFDAHADMNTPETSPSGNIHGMPLAVSLGYGIKELTHLGGFAPKLEPSACVHIGARDIDTGERKLLKQLGIRFMTMREIDERGIAACLDEALALIKQRAPEFAVTFDIDVLDPSDAPGSGTLVRGGLTYREAHLAMEKIAEAGGLRALEVVEINTMLDRHNRTGQLGTELILSALGKTIL